MIKWPIRCTIVAVALQCIGCAADTAGTDPGEMRNTTEVRKDAGQEGVSTPPGIDPLGAPDARPTLDAAEKGRDLVASPYLSTESTLIEQDALSADRADEILEDRALFAKALERMRDDEKTSMEAQDLARHHRSVLVRAVGSQGVVDDLACGLSLCIGAVTAHSREHHDAWHGRLVKDPAARRYGAIHWIEPVADQFQKRFVFSADPAVAAIHMNR